MTRSANLHSVSESATRSRREQTARTISLCAQRLADEHGLDGFTMDQLAEEAGVSRRTLFNYFPGKIDAVLGPDEPPDRELVAPFAANGPTGDLVEDIRLMVFGYLESKEADAETMARFRRLIRSDARIMHAVHGRLEQATAHFTELIAERESADADSRRIRITARLLLALFDIALEGFVDDPDTGLAHHFNETFATAHDLLGHTHH